MYDLGIDYLYRGHTDRVFRSKWKKQRANMGFAECDIFNMCDFLLNLIPAMLENLAENHVGIPFHPSEFREMTDEEWMSYLLDTAEKFKRVLKLSEEPVGESIEKYIHERDSALKEAFDALQIMFFALWD